MFCLMSCVETVWLRVWYAHEKALEMRMQKLVLGLPAAQIFPEKINKMLSQNYLVFINVNRSVRIRKFCVCVVCTDKVTRKFSHKIVSLNESVFHIEKKSKDFPRKKKLHSFHWTFFIVTFPLSHARGIWQISHGLNVQNCMGISVLSYQLFIVYIFRVTGISSQNGTKIYQRGQ